MFFILGCQAQYPAKNACKKHLSSIETPLVFKTVKIKCHNNLKVKNSSCSSWCIICSAVVPLPPGNDSVIFYLLKNGSDTTDCGRSAGSPCASLLHILMTYYTESPTVGLKIIIDQSLVIDNEIMVSVPEFYSTWISHMKHIGLSTTGHLFYFLSTVMFCDFS